MRRTFIIKNSLCQKIVFKFDGNFKILHQSKNFSIIGNFATFLLKNKIYKTQSIEKLSKFYNVSSLISNSIGKFLIFDHAINTIYLSLNFGSLYFLNENTFYNLEKNLIKDKKIKKKIYDIDFFLKSHRHIAPYPFNGILEDIKRIPAGFSYDLKNKKKKLIIINNNLIIKPNRHNYLNLLSQVLKEYKKFYKKNFQLAFSGGMDSTVLFLIMKKNKLKFNTYHNISNLNFSNSIDYLLCKHLSSKFKTSLTLRYQRSISEKKILNEFYTHYSFHFKSDQVSKVSYPYKKNYIVGQNLDTLYYVDTFAPNTYTLGFKRYFKILKTFHLRFINTPYFIKLYNLYLILLKKNVKKIQIQSYLNIWTSEKEHVHYLDFDTKSNKQNIKRKKYFFKNILPILNYETKYQSFISNLKILKFLRFVINTNQHYEILQLHYKCNILTPYSESVMQNFFYNKSLNFFETFYIKYLQDFVITSLNGISFHFLQIFLKINSKYISKNKQNRKSQKKILNQSYVLEKLFKKFKINKSKFDHPKIKNKDELLKLMNLSIFLR